MGPSQALKKAFSGDEEVVRQGKCLPDEAGFEAGFQHCKAHACNPGPWIRGTAHSQ